MAPCQTSLQRSKSKCSTLLYLTHWTKPTQICHSLGLFFNRNVRNTRYDEENRVIWRDLLLPIPDDPSKKVDVSFFFFIIPCQNQNSSSRNLQPHHQSSHSSVTFVRNLPGETFTVFTIFTVLSHPYHGIVHIQYSYSTAVIPRIRVRCTDTLCILRQCLIKYCCANV